MVEDFLRDQPPLPKPRFPKLDPAQTEILYDEEGDILLIRFGPTGPATSVDIEGEFWLRMDPLSGDVHGIEVENFQTGYLGRHPELAEMWRVVAARNRNHVDPEAGTALIRRLLKSAKSTAAHG